MSHIYTLVHDEARRRAKVAIDAAPDGYVVRIGPPKRNLEQSAKFHAICSRLSHSKRFAGEFRSPEQWKILLVSGHAMATKHGSEMVPGIEGEWCNLRESTATMSVKRMSSLIEYASAYCAENAFAIDILVEDQ